MFTKLVVQILGLALEYNLREGGREGEREGGREGGREGEREGGEGEG